MPQYERHLLSRFLGSEWEKELAALGGEGRGENFRSDCIIERWRQPVAGGLRWEVEIVAILATITMYLGRAQQKSGFLSLFFDCVGLFSLFFRFLAKFRPNLGQIRYKSPTQSKFFAIFHPFLIPRA